MLCWIHSDLGEIDHGFERSSANLFLGLGAPEKSAERFAAVPLAADDLHASLQVAASGLDRIAG